ncbi:HPr family phosphocarrier protein [Pseudonocardia sp.]|uniref:HPr family phosphocarrier protein n=1 Tax=Pseudonocardia sp. TaxID=60912 RepID=UPI0031FC1365
MPSRTVTVASRVGLHARPAAVFTRAAAAAPVPVTLAVAGKDPVNAASVLGVMTLGVECGQEVTLAAEGEGADGALDSLAALLATDLDA